MSTDAAPRRKYQRITAEHLAHARKRFGEFASTSAVKRELAAMGGDYAYNALHYYWKKANPPSADPDPADEARAA